MKQALTLFLGLIATLLCLPVLPVQAQESKPVPRFEPTPCFVQIPANQTIECGYLIVPEDRSQSESRTIRLAVAILKSPVQNPEPDPLVFLNGGPGGQGLADLPRFISIFRLLLIDLNRDVILFSQRGADMSQPVLDCPEVGPTMLAQTQGERLTCAEEQAPYLACRDRWLSEGVNLAAYTTAASAADVNDLWRTLGYSQVNLFGTSYGTVLAETVMRDYPTGIRSVILDSAFPLQIDLQADTASNLSLYFNRVFTRCATDWLCRIFYPDVDERFYSLLAQLNDTQIQLTMPQPFTGVPFTFPFDGVGLIEVAQSIPPRELPALIYDLSEGNYSAVFKSKKATIENLTIHGAPPGRAMASSIFCSQGLYGLPLDLDRIASYPEAIWVEHFVNHTLLPHSCEQWPSSGELDARPAISDIPTFIFLGEFDPTLSPEYADLFTADLSHSFIVTVPNTGHGVMKSGPCVNNLARAFLNDPTRLPPTDCLAETGRPVFDTPFLVRAAVMSRPIQGLLILLGLGLALITGVNIIAWRRATFPLGFAWRHSLRLVGWRVAVGSAGLLGLGWVAGQAGWLPIEPVNIVALLLPILTALSAAFLFSPEDEPALELLLTTPRPLTWILLERLTALFLWQGSVGLVASLFVASLSGESIAVNIIRWLPPLICLSVLAVCITLATRRAIYGVLLVSLLWLVFFIFGDFIVLQWPFTWPFHIYLQPDQVEYGLNRLFLLLGSTGLIVFSAPHLLRDEERLLLGKRFLKRRQAKARREGNYAGEALNLPVTTWQPDLRQNSWRLPVYQIGAMIRYEFLLQWRRVALPALGLGIMFPAILGAFLARNQFGRYSEAVTTGALSLETARANITAEMISITWLGAILVLILMLPFVVAETIPKDRHLGVREVLDSLPLGPGIYLTGKVLSLWLSLSITLGLAALIIAAIWRLVIGPFNLDIYLELWLVGVIPLALINAGLTSLLAAGQPNNKRAMMVGGVFSLLCLFGLGFAFVTYGTFWDWLNPARPAVLLYYAIGWPGAMQGNEILSRLNQSALDLITQYVNHKRVMQSLLAGLGQVGLIGLLIWLWRRRTS